STGLANGATQVAHYGGSSYPLVVTKASGAGRVVALNFYPPSSDARSDSWDPNFPTTGANCGARLMLNALSWAGGTVAPHIATQPTGQTVVQGSAVTFTVTATGTQTLSYQWMFNGAAIWGATSSTLVVGSAQ